jgi:Zn-finger nucleic acid-binding protein
MRRLNDGVMHCPKCQMNMEKLEHASIEVERCTNCKGIWFDALELDHLLKTPGSEIIDTGHEKIGEQYNRKDRFACPKCSSQTMIRMVDARQPHIHFEQCKICGGSFLDAGEFRDLREESFLDFFRSLRPGKKH